MTDYESFLASKFRGVPECGFDPDHLAGFLYPFQSRIERCVKLWSAPGDVMFSPFMGIGSEGYVAIQQGRKFIGIELKPSYYQVARDNLAEAVRKRHEGNHDLLDWAEEQDAS